MPLEERSNWGRRLARGEFVTTVEVLPPKGCDATKTLESIRLLKEAGVNAVNIPDGPRAQTRMSAQATAVLVEREIGLESVLHYCCRDRNLLGMMSDLLGAAALGLRNLLLITGDPPKMGPYPDATAVFDIDSIGLTNMVNKLNHGLDLGNNPIGHADLLLHRRRRQPRRGQSGRRDQALRVEGRGRRRVRHHAAGLRHRTAPRLPQAHRARPRPRRRGHLAARLLPQRRVPPQRSARRPRHALHHGAHAPRLREGQRRRPRRRTRHRPRMPPRRARRHPGRPGLRPLQQRQIRPRSLRSVSPNSPR